MDLDKALYSLTSIWGDQPCYRRHCELFRTMWGTTREWKPYACTGCTISSSDLCVICRQWAAVSHTGRRRCQGQCWHKAENCCCAQPVVCEYRPRSVCLPVCLSIFIYCPFGISMCIYIYMCACMRLFWMCYDCEFVFDPIQDRSRAVKYQVSPDMQHVLFAFEVKPVRNESPPPLTCNYLTGCPSLTVKPFLSADLPTFLSGQVHYLQPCDTVRPTSVVFSFHLSVCLIIFTVTVVDSTAWPQPDLT